MRLVEPKVKLISKPQIEWANVERYLEEIGGLDWYDRVKEQPSPDGEDLSEFAGRLCYRSWKPELNPNVTRVRENSAEYLQNVVNVMHGSVFEHANYSFILQDVSRVVTHEWVRHRAGCAYSQESLRFVRLSDLNMWFPEWAQADKELMDRSLKLLEDMEGHQKWMAEHFGLDDEGVPFSEKKAKTSFMRRMAPDGVATAMVWTANIRSIRHILEMRTAEGAEEEIRLVADQVGQVMLEEAPAVFGDYTITESGAWVPGSRKI